MPVVQLCGVSDTLAAHRMPQARHAQHQPLIKDSVSLPSTGQQQGYYSPAFIFPADLGPYYAKCGAAWLCMKCLPGVCAAGSYVAGRMLPTCKRLAGQSCAS